jgi:lysophospholipase L1-like esterase
MRSRSDRRFQALEQLEGRVLPSQMLAPEQSVAPVPSAFTSWEMPLHAQYVAEAAQGGASVVFLGDSITYNWTNANNPAHLILGDQVWDSRIAPFKTLNFGVAGDQTENLIWRIENGELAGQPKLAVVMIGTNNLGFGQTPQETADGVAAVLSAIHNESPQTKVLLMGILPRGATATDPLRIEVSETNALISRLANGSQVQFLDIDRAFLEPDGQLRSGFYMPDNLHILGPGYQVWAGALQDTLVDMLGDQTPTAQPPTTQPPIAQPPTVISIPAPVTAGAVPATPVTTVPAQAAPAAFPAAEPAMADILIVIESGPALPGAPGISPAQPEATAGQKSAADGLANDLAADLLNG